MGERLGWFQVASHLRSPVGELKQRLTYSEFLEWVVFLTQEEERLTPANFYLAQIAAEVRRSYVKDARKVKVVDFVVKRATKEEQQKSHESKSIWLGAFKIKPKQK